MGYIVCTIGIIPELINKWQNENKFTDFINCTEVYKFRDFGDIRNEEDFVMKNNGANRLGTNIKPKTIAEIEVLRKG